LKLRHRGTLGWLSLMTVVISIFATTVPAYAAPKVPGNYIKSYSVWQERYSPPLKRCVRITLWGKITFRLLNSGKAGIVYTNVKVKSPTMRVSALSKCGRGGKVIKINKAQLVQQWYSRNCSLKASASGSFPWTLGGSVWVDCGTRKALRRVTKHTAKKPVSYFDQNNSGTTLSFNGRVAYKNAGRTKELCLESKPSTTLHRSNVSDSFDMTLKACVSP
jgi:hypothetical protein